VSFLEFVLAAAGQHFGAAFPQNVKLFLGKHVFPTSGVRVSDQSKELRK